MGNPTELLALQLGIAQKELNRLQKKKVLSVDDVDRLAKVAGIVDKALRDQRAEAARATKLGVDPTKAVALVRRLIRDDSEVRAAAREELEAIDG